MEIVKSVAVNLLTQAAYEGLKQIPPIQTRFGETRIIFQLIADLYEIPPYDEANTEVNEILDTLKTRGNQLSLNDHAFGYQVDWDKQEGCTIPEYESSDMLSSDIFIDVGIGEESLLQCVQGFRIKIFPANNMEVKIAFEKGYELLDKIRIKIMRDTTLKIHSTIIAVAFIAKSDVNESIKKRINKKIKHPENGNNVNINKISDENTEIVIYIKDRLTLQQVVDALTSWWVF